MAIPNLAHDAGAHTQSTAGITGGLSRWNRGEHHASAALCRDDQEPTEHLSPQTLIDCDARLVVSRAVHLLLPAALHPPLTLLTMART